jgi:hypothetical protein
MPRPARIFIRDDDVGELTPEFQQFFKLFYERGLPVSYQIIPERFTPECAKFLLKARARRPDLVEFGQHGLRHQMMVRGKLEFFEFGPLRSYDEQFADIAEGRELLRQRLGDVPIEVFTPPRHRYDRNTTKALANLGFSIFSASSYATPRHRLAYSLAQALKLSSIGARGVPYHGRKRPDGGLYELSIAVAADDGANPTGTPQAVGRAIARACSREDAVGVMFHHQAYRGEAGEKQLRELIQSLDLIDGAGFHTMSDLLKAGAPS